MLGPRSREDASGTAVADADSMSATSDFRPAVAFASLLVLALAVGCTASPQLNADAAVVTAAQCTLPGGRVIPAGMAYGQAGDCNMCICQPPSGVFCYTAGCADADVGQRRCQSDGDCGSYGTCLFDPGCGSEPGYCVPATEGCAQGAPSRPGLNTPATAQRFCGCDGITYASNCPSVRYAHAGACGSN